MSWKKKKNAGKSRKKINLKKKIKKKAEETKVKEIEMWECLAKLNGEFKDIKEAKKESKKMSETIIN